MSLRSRGWEGRRKREKTEGEELRERRQSC